MTMWRTRRLRRGYNHYIIRDRVFDYSSINNKTIQPDIVRIGESILQNRINHSHIEAKWSKSFYQHGSYSFHLVKYSRLDYAIGVKRDGEEFCCILLRPLITRGATCILNSLGFPIDVEGAVNAVESVIDKFDKLKTLAY